MGVPFPECPDCSKVGQGVPREDKGNPDCRQAGCQFGARDITADRLNALVTELPDAVGTLVNHEDALRTGTEFLENVVSRAAASQYRVRYPSRGVPLRRIRHTGMMSAREDIKGTTCTSRLYIQDREYAPFPNPGQES
ncbi:hypothetical protein ASZ90_016990 [hydrocarbon metagenome]|uniref:Uncharacterized protein n=1 Tax=hydrocarbon metagenome TaxID=938273 RepID=A0A0W8EAN2_9ZZZZ